MDFGENLKHAREQKGYTQQHLADELYVTRQAVSKWECGTRYPDLFTAKCIADILDVSIDSLVSNDEMKSFSEKQSIVQSRIGEQIISSLYAIVVLFSVIELSQKIIGVTTQFKSLVDGITAQSAVFFVLQILFCISVLYLSLLAFVKSIKDKLNPKEAGIIGMCFFGYYALNNITVIAFRYPIWKMILINYALVMFIIIIGAYFLRNKSKLCCLHYISSLYHCRITLYCVLIGT